MPARHRQPALEKRKGTGDGRLRGRAPRADGTSHGRSDGTRGGRRLGAGRSRYRSGGRERRSGRGSRAERGRVCPRHPRGHRGAGHHHRGHRLLDHRVDALRHRPTALPARDPAVHQRHHRRADEGPQHHHDRRGARRRHRHHHGPIRQRAAELLFPRLSDRRLPVRRGADPAERHLAVRRQQRRHDPL